MQWANLPIIVYITRLSDRYVNFQNYYFSVVTTTINGIFSVISIICKHYFLLENYYLKMQEQEVKALHVGITTGSIVKTFNVSRNAISKESNIKFLRSNVKFPVVKKAFMAKVKTCIKRDPLKIMRAIAKVMNVSEKTVRRVVKDPIGAKS